MEGKPKFKKKEYERHIDVIEDEIRLGLEEKRQKYENEKPSWWERLGAEGKQDYIENKARKEVIYKRTNLNQLVETGSTNRVIRALLLGLKNGYTKAELSKPFVMLRLVPSPDYEDPETRRLLARASVNTMTGVFGTPPEPRQIGAPNGVINVEAVDVNEIPPSMTPENDDLEPETGSLFKGSTGNEPKSSNNTLSEVFSSVPETQDRLQLISDEAKRRGFASTTQLWEFYERESGKPKPRSALSMPEADMLDLYLRVMACQIVSIPVEENPIEQEENPIKQEEIPF